VRTAIDVDVDVAVIGGGPAGLATALRLAEPPGLSVTVLERAEEPRVKIGETVPPEVRPVLEGLGVWPAFQAAGHLPGWGTSSCWGSPDLGYNDFLFQPAGHGWHLDRARFEADLEKEAVARGVCVRRSVGVRTAMEISDGWSLRVRTAKGEESLRARIVVDASGRQAAFASQQGARRLAFDALAGVYRFFVPHRPRETGLTLVEADENGWWYSAALPGGRAVACFMTDADLLHRLRLGGDAGWQAQAARSRQTAARLRAATALGPPRVKPAASSVLDLAAGRAWLAVGDAASTFDPLSSRGILKALLSGTRAAAAVRSALAGDREALPLYAEQVWSEMERYLAVREQHYGLERRWPGAPFWSRRHERITLDPRRELRAAPAAEQTGRGARGWGMHLPESDRGLLAQLCRSPRPAHDLIAAFRAGCPRTYSDRRIVLAVQHLLATGVIG
jgi:flavin-dependent dehydrogenase